MLVASHDIVGFYAQIGEQVKVGGLDIGVFNSDKRAYQD
jgi:hypothetical protein